MHDVTISPAGLAELRQAVQGTVLTPGSEGYDEARTLFNAMIDRRPAVIVQCANSQDVARAVGFAQDEGLSVGVKGGGHSVAGFALVDGGLVVDLSAMRKVTVDAGAGVVRVEGGSLWGDVDTATQPHGLATTGGRNSVTGVAGLTLGGGSGWLERRFGLACDNLHAVELLTAAGELVRASATEEPELFWALHGGGGNFGVATALELKLHEIGPEILAGLLIYEAEKGRELLELWRDVILAAPDELGGAFVYFTAPVDPDIPEHLQGKLVSCVIPVWSGDMASGEEVLRPFRDFGRAVDLVGPTPYADFQSSIDDPPGCRNYWTAEYLHQMPQPVLDSIVRHSESLSRGPAQSFTVPWGGAVARVPADATPLSKRDARFVVHPFALWEGAENDEYNISWARGFAEEMRSFATGGVWLNWVGDEGEDRIRAAFGPEGYARLQAVKARFDPDNVFRSNQNIKPALAQS
jgi:FAD/FMN-containing dehydrogenase